MIGLFGFGVIAAEILNNFNLFNFKIEVYFLAVPISLIFLVSELLLRHFEIKASSSVSDEIKYQRVKNYYYLFLSGIGFFLLISIPFLWWGAIKKLARLANESMKHF